MSHSADLEPALEPFVEIMDRVRVISTENLHMLAADCGLSRLDAEIAALELGVLPRRYLRNVGTVGLGGQLALLRSWVGVIGLGGLGGYIVEGLSRMGVGKLTLVDGDVFFDHNLNRQLLSNETTLGRGKAEVACERVRQVNSAVEVACYADFATIENLRQLLSGLNVVVDALDRLPSRLVLQEAAAEVGIPMVHGAIAGWMGQVMTIMPGDAGLRALYGDGPIPDQGAEAELGSPPASPMMVAAWQVHETVKVLLGKGDLLRGRMLFIDASVAEIRVLDLT